MSIPITKPFFGREEMDAVQQPLATGWVVQGPFVKRFEEKFSSFTGAAHSIAASSCTTALHMAVAALGLKPGDEVVVPALTWVATANVVEYMGARPIFCDIDLSTYNLDPARAESLITERTVGIIPVHLFGLCADMARISAIAARHGLWVIEDAACAFGAWLDGKHAGTMGDFGCFSFHPRKSITTGEGGMITSDRPDYADLCRTLRDHGASRSDFSRHHESGSFLLSDYDHLGYNYRMTDLQAALGCAQMDRADWILQRRRELAMRYDGLLRDLPWLAPPVVAGNRVHGYQAYVTLFQPDEPSPENTPLLHQRRNRLMGKLEAKGVATRQGTHAPVTLGYYARKYRLRGEDFPKAVVADRLTLALPLFPQMTNEEQDFVVDSLREGLDA